MEPPPTSQESLDSILDKIENAKAGILSSTKISAWLNCPFYYYLNYIQRVKVPKPVHFVFGQAIHHALDAFFKVNFKSADSFAKKFSYYWMNVIAGTFLTESEKNRINLKVKEIEIPNNNPDYDEDEYVMKIGSHIRFYGDPKNSVWGYLGAGKKMLKLFFDANKNKAPPLFRELRISKFPFQYSPKSKRFRTKGVVDRIINKASPLFRRLKIGKFPFQHGSRSQEFSMMGIMDRIDELKEGGKALSDYKTDKRIPFMDDIHNGHQLTIYHAAFTHKFGKPPDRMFYYHMPTGLEIETFREDKHYKELSELCGMVVRGIEETKAFTPISRYRCGACQYRFDDVCDRYLADYERAVEKIILPVTKPWGDFLNDRLPEPEEPKKRKRPRGKKDEPLVASAPPGKTISSAQPDKKYEDKK